MGVTHREALPLFRGKHPLIKAGMQTLGSSLRIAEIDDVISEARRVGGKGSALRHDLRSIDVPCPRVGA